MAINNKFLLLLLTSSRNQTEAAKNSNKLFAVKMLLTDIKLISVSLGCQAPTFTVNTATVCVCESCAVLTAAAVYASQSKVYECWHSEYLCTT